MWLLPAAITDVTGVDATQLGVSGVIVVILLVAVRSLWLDNQKLREQSRLDQQAMLPALTQASASTAAAATAIERVMRLYDQAQPRNRGD